MTSKAQLESRIRELEAELQSFREQLDNYKEVTLEAASVGDVLEDGSIVLKKENGLALLVAPASTEVLCQWSKAFPEVFDKLKVEGFNPSQWFVPTKEQLKLAYNLISSHFDADTYWSSTEIDSAGSYCVSYASGFAYCLGKTLSRCVRAFRCVTY